jgi:23S rRNA (uracil1939-C5)-methyltransferase
VAQRRAGPRFITGRRAPSAGRDKGTGQIFEAKVIGLADTGNAVVEHPDGRRFFVPGAWLGERIRVKVKELKTQYGIGELVELLETSPERISPPCQFHGFAADQCGGCAWMFVDYEAQLRAKQQRVEQAIHRLVADQRVLPILQAPEPLGYRVRAQLKTDGHELGFVANAQRQLVAVDDCLVLSPHNRSTLRGLREQLPRPEWAPHRKQDWTTLDIDESVSVESVSINKRLPFQQANRQQNHNMRAWLKNRLEALPRHLPVLELFAGSGNFTDVIAAAGFESITAVEVVPEAVAALRARELPRVLPVTCDLFDETAFADLLQHQRTAEILVLDPPRDGLKCRNGLFDRRSRLREILYVSCDLATFIRDLRDFLAAGYVLDELQPVDLFPQTPHVELLAHLRRSRP